MGEFKHVILHNRRHHHPVTNVWCNCFTYFLLSEQLCGFLHAGWEQKLEMSNLTHIFMFGRLDKTGYEYKSLHTYV